MKLKHYLIFIEIVLMGFLYGYCVPLLISARDDLDVFYGIFIILVTIVFYANRFYKWYNRKKSKEKKEKLS